MVGAAGTCAAAAGRVVVVFLGVGQAWRDEEKAGAKKQVDEGQGVGTSGFGVGEVRRKKACGS